MATIAWTEPAHVSLLQWLAKGPLKHNLPQAARLWVWLHLFYGSEDQRLLLPSVFTYADCREILFTASHPGSDKVPTQHDDDCLCQKSLAAWLFSPRLNDTSSQWQAWQGENEEETSQIIQQWTCALQQMAARPEAIESLLRECQPFAVTRRTLSNDLKRLRQLGWLRLVERGYQKVSHWPDYPTVPAPREVSFLIQPDLAEIAANLSEKIGEQQRFFVHTDYVVPQAGHDRVEDWQANLTELWQQTPVPPIQLSYWSAALLQRCEVAVYPVCIYYYRRGPYLCAWGQVPGDATTDWRNYRLDKIHRIAPLSWQDGAVPAALRQAYQQHRLPDPEEIQIRMSEAWGFDYYQPAERLLVRFDAEWDERYIRNSLRHNTFERISYEAARSLIRQLPAKSKSRQLLALLAKRSPEDAYYQALYRRNDPNVRQRLRAWRPHIEVILPWTLRQSFAQEVMKEKGFYETH